MTMIIKLCYKMFGRNEFESHDSTIWKSRQHLVSIFDDNSRHFIGIDFAPFNWNHKAAQTKVDCHLWFTIGNMCLVIVTTHNNTYFVDTVINNDHENSSVKKGCETFEPLFGLS